MRNKTIKQRFLRVGVLDKFKSEFWRQRLDLSPEDGRVWLARLMRLPEDRAGSILNSTFAWAKSVDGWHWWSMIYDAHFSDYVVEK
jgi:hypothetical protein